MTSVSSSFVLDLNHNNTGVQMTTHQEPVLNIVPVEIWRIIFRLVLGPSLSNPHRNGYHGYKHLFTLHDKIVASYKAVERLRWGMSSVCRSWRLVLTDMDDAVVIQGPDGLLWPPGKSIERAKLAIRVDNVNWATMVTNSPLILSTSAPIRAPSPFDPSQTAATGLRVSGNTLNLLDKEVESPTIKLLGCRNFSPTNDFQAIWQTAFRNLVVLQIRTSYPFHNLNPCPPLQLLQLRCLFLGLHAGPTSDRHQYMVSTWFFPCLETLRLTNLGIIPRLADELSTFLRAHASTIREVVIGGSIWSSFDILPIWPLLTRLELYQFENLDALVQALPVMKQTPIVADQSKRLFQVLLHSLKVTKETAVKITRGLNEHGPTLAQLDIRFVFYWVILLSGGDDHELLRGILRDTGLIIIDQVGCLYTDIP